MVKSNYSPNIESQVVKGIPIPTVTQNWSEFVYITDPEDPNNISKLQMVRISPVSANLKNMWRSSYDS